MMRIFLLAVFVLFTLLATFACNEASDPSNELRTVTPDFAGQVTTSPDPPSTAIPPAGFPPLTPRQSTPVFNAGTGVTRIPIPPALAADGGREDCPETWLVFENDTYSVCFPPNFYAHRWFTDASTIHFSLRLIAGEPLAYTPWGITLSTDSTYTPPDTCVYQAEQIATDADTELQDYEIAGISTIACRAQIGGAVQFKGDAPIPSGSLAFYVHAQVEDQFPLALQVLDTVRLVEPR